MTFREKLEDLRKSFDLYPWVEFVEKDVAAGAAAGQVVKPTIQKPYAMLVDDITAEGNQHWNDGADHFASVDFDVKWSVQVGDSPNDDDRLVQPFDVSTAIGTAADGWHHAGNGLFLEKNQRMDFEVTTGDAIGAGGLGGRFGFALRAMRLYPAGSIQPVQKTLPELRKDGAKLERYGMGTRLDLGVSTAEVTSEFIFDRNFVATRMLVRWMAPADAPAGFVKIRIDADRSFMGDYASSFLVTTEKPLSSWQPPIPFTIPKNTRWVFRAVQDVAPANATKVDILFRGYELK